MLCHSPRGKSRYILIAFVTIITLFLATGCGTPGSSAFNPAKQAASAPLVAADGSQTTTSILLFTGTGTDANDVSAVEAMLTSMKLGYATANSSELEGMSQSKLETYKLFIVPGGDSITIGDGLSTTATNNVHNAVIVGGLHYLGVCAGAFFGGYSKYNGLNLTSGVWFSTYTNNGKGTGKTAVETSQPSGTSLDQYWQDGPELDGWGSIVGKYPNGTSAIVEGSSGKGWVILSGIHAEAPASWRIGMNFTTSVSVDNAYFSTLVDAALNATSLPHY